MILPVYALQHYIEWEVVDGATLKGTIRDGDCSASGCFHFNEQGLMSSFTTNDRYFAENDRYHNYAWTACVSHYICRGDLLFPAEFKAIWHLPSGDHEYFRGEMTRLEFNSTVLSDNLNHVPAAPEI